MDIRAQLRAWDGLRTFIVQFVNDKKLPELEELNSLFYDEFQKAIERSKILNGWFTKDNIVNALEGISALLHPQVMEKWLKNYTLETSCSKQVAVIMAGNIPLVGFHDFLCVLISGHQFIGKLSSDDPLLLPLLAKVLEQLEPGFKQRISFTDGRLPNDINAVIATGSNNTSRYFTYYFSKYPHIIRKNRNSVAVLTGEETTEELAALGKDIFLYFGLGCRNVSKLYVPKGYSFNTFFESIFPYQEVINNKKYANNHEYYRAVYLMNRDQLLDNNFLLLKEDKAIASPVGMLFYEYYEDRQQLKSEIETRKDEIQCVVGNKILYENAIPLGQAQFPAPWDYADGIDVLQFLQELKTNIMTDAK